MNTTPTTKKIRSIFKSFSANPLLKWTLAWAILLIGLCLGYAEANISVYPMSIVLNANDGGTLEVSSSSQDTSYVKVTVKRMMYEKGSLNAVEHDIKVFQDAVFAVPNMFVLPPRGKRTVRFVLSTPPDDTERAYRVYVEAVPPVQDKDETPDSAAPNTALAMNVIWGALLLVPPAERHVSLEYAPATGLLKNTGNTFLNVVNSSLCTAPGACTSPKLAIPTLPPQGEFNIKTLLAQMPNLKEVTLTYEDRSSKNLHEIKIKL